MKLYLIILLNLILITTTFAQKEREKGIEFYKNGDYKSAVHYLNLVRKEVKKDDGEFWNYLGLSYLQLNKYKESRKALENAVKLNPQSAAYRINLAYSCFQSNKLSQADKEIQKAIILDPKNAVGFYIRGLVFLRKGKFDDAVTSADQALGLDKTLGVLYSLKSNSYLYKFGQEIMESKNITKNIGLLKNSVEVLEKCMKDCAENSVKIEIGNDLVGIKAFFTYFSEKDEDFLSEIVLPRVKKFPQTVSTPTDPTVTPLSITAKPRANYTDSARQAGVQGTITLAVLFSADGVSKRILIIKPLSNGLTEEAVKAAQQITYNPEMKDGKPIPVVKTIQYKFTLY